MPFRTTRRVEFRDTDMAGIMHFSAFFTTLESVEHEFLRSLGLSVVMERRFRAARLAARLRELRLQRGGQV